MGSEEPALAPAPAPASPRRAAAPKPKAKTAPTPGRSNVAATTPADIPVAPPTKPPTVAPNCLEMVLASLSDLVRKTMDCSGTPCSRNSLTASSAWSRAENTPIAVSIRSPHDRRRFLNPATSRQIDFLLSYLPLNVKSAFAAWPPATVTLAV